MSVDIMIQPDYNITAATSDRLKEELTRAIHEGKNNIVIDFKDVNLIDSTGLSILISAHNSVKDVHPLALQNVSDDIKRLLTITRLDKHFQVI